jgi:hypothetical protein
MVHTNVFILTYTFNLCTWNQGNWDWHGGNVLILEAEFGFDLCTWNQGNWDWHGRNVLILEAEFGFEANASLVKPLKYSANCHGMELLVHSVLNDWMLIHMLCLALIFYHTTETCFWCNISSSSWCLNGKKSLLFVCVYVRSYVERINLPSHQLCPYQSVMSLQVYTLINV